MLSPGLFDLARFPRAHDLQASTVVVTPTYRERDTIERHVRSVFSALPGVSLLVVDETSADGTSPDGTSDVVEALRGEFERLHLLRHAPPRSFSGSYKDGIAWALERGFGQIISMDADGSHGPVFLPLLLDLSAEADLVVGSRYLNGVSVLNWPLRRVLLSAFANIYCRWVTGVPCYDLTAGFCCYRAEMLRRIGVPRVRASGYAYQIEMKYRIWREGAVRRDEHPLPRAARGDVENLPGADHGGAAPPVVVPLRPGAAEDAASDPPLPRLERRPLGWRRPPISRAPAPTPRSRGARPA